MSQSYIPLYRKYRPQTFADLVGQEILVKALSNAIKLDKISHAYLFCGSRGTGKTSGARILAKSLNCLEGPTATPCGKCSNCVDITNGSAIDVIEIDAASNNSVEDARNILEKVQFVPVSGKYKIFIIDEVHMLSNSAFNTLLKTLEEPPENLVFILATTEPHKILDTIISRCQRFDFRKIKIDDITSRLKYIASQEDINISDEAIEMIAQKSTGGLRDAVALLDQASVLGLAGSQVSIDDILSISGALSQDNLFALTEALVKKEPHKLIELINSITNQGNEPILVLKELVSYFRNLLLIKSGGDSEHLSNLLVLSEQFIPKLKEQAELFEVIEIAQIIEKMAEYEVTLRNATNQMMWLEVILVSILHRQDIKVLKDLETRVSSLEAALAGGNAPVPKTLAPTARIKAAHNMYEKPAPKPEVIEKHNSPQYPKSSVEQPYSKPASPGSADLKEQWVSILENVEKFSTKRFLVDLAKPIKLNDKKIIIALKNKIFFSEDKMASLQEAVNKTYSKEVRIETITFDEIKDIKDESDDVSDVAASISAPSEDLKKKSKSLTAPISEDIAPKIEASQQIEHSIGEEIEQLDEPPSLLEERVADSELAVCACSKEPDRHQFSDDTAMFIDLFQGKIIE